MAHRVLMITLAAVLVAAFGTGVFAQDKHPQITAALKSLDEANKHLDQAGGGFGGNKAKAQVLIKQAQQELKEALAFAAGNKSTEQKAPGATEKAKK
jgi:hypothetical protein